MRQRNKSKIDRTEKFIAELEKFYIEANAESHIISIPSNQKQKDLNKSDEMCKKYKNKFFAV